MVYLAGFGNHHQTEAVAGALPTAQNSPQQSPLGLYAEQLSGSAFTRPRHLNLHSWLYRTLPSVVHPDYIPYAHPKRFELASLQAPNPYRWACFPMPAEPVDFVDGLLFIAGNAVANTYLYQCTTSMAQRIFCNQDGEMLFVPYLGEMSLFTEFGRLSLSPGQIAVIPRGVKFKTELISKEAAGYLCENKQVPFTLPHLGIMGVNALANPRHFLYPKAQFETSKETVTWICKYQNSFWCANNAPSPLNVLAWHGNYAPYSYDLSLFNTMNTVSFDHPDPSIFTVLSAESNTLGVANLDFVIFPPRWMVALHTFRPPYFHRNVMSELMGLITGQYDAKKEGFSPGGISIHNGMTAHGPDALTYQEAVSASLQPTYYANTLAFMFEAQEPWQVSDMALHHPTRDVEYTACWQDLKNHYQD